MIIDEKKCIDTILKLAPDFKPQWEEYLEYWENKSPGICSDLAEFSHFIEDNILKFTDEKLIEIFFFVEKLLINGNTDVSSAAATCFLENLINFSSHNKPHILRFLKFLVPESKAYCKVWDEFTGVKTSGLWGEREEFRPRKNSAT